MSTRLRVSILAVIVAVVLVTVVSPRSDQATPQDAGADVVGDVSYGSHPQQTFDVYLPQGRSGLLPAIIWIHGGGWVQGDKTDPMPIWDWTRRGYVVVSINYRLAAGTSTVSDSVDDTLDAISTVRARSADWSVDPNRIALYGHSAGGHLAAMAASANRDLAGVVITSAPTDLREFLGDSPKDFVNLQGDSVVMFMESVLGCRGQTCEFAASEVDPTRGDVGDVAMLILHGSHDEIVPSSQARLLADRLKGSQVELRIVEGGGHETFLSAGAGNFLEWALRGTSPSGQTQSG